MKLSKGTEEFINRLKVSFLSENVAMCMGDTFPWENHQEFGKVEKGELYCPVCVTQFPMDYRNRYLHFSSKRVKQLEIHEVYHLS